MPPNKKKKLVRFRTPLQAERRRQNRFAKSGLRNWQRATGATTANQEKWLKDDKAPKEPLKLPRNRV